MCAQVSRVVVCVSLFIESIFPHFPTTGSTFGLETERTEPCSVCSGGAEGWDLPRGSAMSPSGIPSAWVLVQQRGCLDLVAGMEKKAWIWGVFVRCLVDVGMGTMEESDGPRVSSLGHRVDGLTINWARRHRRGGDVRFSSGLVEAEHL